MIRFYLNGKPHELTDLNPNTTVLEYLRSHVRQMDTKEGCGSGDCGACTVMVQRLPSHSLNQTTEPLGKKALSEIPPFYTVNSCITLLSLMDGHHLMTASYLADNPEHHPDKAVLHPAQQAMVNCHGSQCGFCTPGFVMSLACVYENKRLLKSAAQNPDTADLSYDEVVASISGNLCRCTGYRPIIEAGLSMQKIGAEGEAKSTAKDLSIDVMAKVSPHAAPPAQTDDLANSLTPALHNDSKRLFIPQNIETLNQLLMTYPKATLWAGGTDLGLSITQHLVDHEIIIQLSAIDALKAWSLQPVVKSDSTGSTDSQELVLGAGMSYQQMLPILEQYFPTFAAVFERIASPQIRNMGTIGGNIANASPIGDLPPILLALDARIHLRHCCSDKSEAIDETQAIDEIMPLSQFFIDYKKTQLRAGSYVVAVHIPLMTDAQHLFIHKISKRYEDDISACLLAMRIDLSEDGERIDNVKIGLGGMAAVPMLAEQCQQALIGQARELTSFEQAAKVLSQDVSPLTDVRASREYRLHVVQRLIVKCGKQLLAAPQPITA
ncbi:xanthine dehydrogenase small subunit [Psychrobacter pygoscelis]|uniref:xanthine dehydrogenase small subunit n=1 Tax=Psychrobacter pygoscelis TaxID=2488563 RepID=UPI00103C03CC|nr:FAD binding domain-containing protein [Psychrobacter pygoscelis]